MSLFAAWVVLGLGMGSGLYEAAFAALVRLYGKDARTTITGIALIAGFASTVGWPPSTFLEAHLGWRGACFVWASLLLLLGLPLNALPPRAAPCEPPPAPTTPAGATTSESMSFRACCKPRACLSAAPCSWALSLALRKVHPLLSARLAAAMHRLGVVLLATLGVAAFAALFTLPHGTERATAARTAQT